MTTLFSAQHISIRREKWQLDNLSFSLKQGEALHILGGNGSGKSTLLHALVEQFPSTGKVDNRASKTLFIEHQLGIKPTLRVDENLVFMATLFDGNSPTERDIAQTLSALSLPQSQFTSDLSKGQQQKLALARLWLTAAHASTLWLLDEPFAHLDAATQVLLTEKLNTHLSAGGGIIITSHQPVQLENLTVLRLD